ncbi:MAG: hypothetical protein FWC68_06370, partial [Oscillospiraceae bacterium]|nr:hypothetical protein [Oscillospiraceae bacterium]
MRNIKSENGAVTLLVIVTILFFIAFLIGSFVVISNQASSQIEMAEQVRRIYEPGDAEEIYDSYFDRGIIHIYNVDELLAIGSGDARVVRGRTVIFTSDALYVLMNDLELSSSASEWDEWHGLRQWMRGSEFTG